MPTLANNKEVRFHYEILDEIEAGIVLSGAEVKSVKLGQINLKGSYITLREEIPYLMNCHISPYAKAKGAQTDYNPDRERRLLLRSDQIKNLIGKRLTEGLTLVPLSLYTRGSFIKVKIGVGRGKRKADKRESIKKREVDRNIQRAMKQSR
ncbi:MAG: SsrA-binding protein SmpB [bacterium]|nr:SsrA-binding protein SmpB [bacterium]